MYIANIHVLIISLTLYNADSIVLNYFVYCHIPRASDSD